MILNHVKIFVIFSLFSLNLSFFEAENINESALERKYGKLLHVSAIFRHGARTPYALYPRDPYNSYPWPDGLGQLLMSGKIQSYNLGKWFHKQYKELLDTVNTHTKILVESSDMDRTIMTAQYFMAGLYPPNKTQRVSKKLRWQPVPIHTTSIKENYIWVSAPCPKMEKYRQNFFQSSKMKRNYDKNRKTFNYLQRHSGFTYSRNRLSTDLWNLYDTLDALWIEDQFNLTLPSWTKKIYPKRLMKLNNLFLYKEFNEPKILKFAAGPMLKSITADMKSNSHPNPNNSTKKFHFYSGHDDSVASIMHALGSYNGINPPYNAALIFELRKKGNDNFIVVQYVNSSVPVPHLLETPKCGNPCTLDKFEKMAHPLTLKNWKEECQLKKHEDSSD